MRHIRVDVADMASPTLCFVVCSRLSVGKMTGPFMSCLPLCGVLEVDRASPLVVSVILRLGGFRARKMSSCSLGITDVGGTYSELNKFSVAVQHGMIPGGEKKCTYFVDENKIIGGVCALTREFKKMTQAGRSTAVLKMIFSVVKGRDVSM